MIVTIAFLLLANACAWVAIKTALNADYFFAASAAAATIYFACLAAMSVRS